MLHDVSYSLSTTVQVAQRKGHIVSKASQSVCHKVSYRGNRSEIQFKKSSHN